MDSHRGKVSVLNLASVRDLEQRLGRAIDPLRFRANIWVEGWAPWVENAWGRPPPGPEGTELPGSRLDVGLASLRGDKPIVRCAAIEVDPTTAMRDELVRELWELTGGILTGLYCSIETGGRIAVGDPVISPA